MPRAMPQNSQSQPGAQVAQPVVVGGAAGSGASPMALMSTRRTKENPPTVTTIATSPPSRLGTATGMRRPAKDGIQRGQIPPTGG